LLKKLKDAVLLGLIEIELKVTTQIGFMAVELWAEALVGLIAEGFKTALSLVGLIMEGIKAAAIVLKNVLRS